jgi:cell division protein FtsW
MEEAKGADMTLVICVLFLIGIGITMVYSSSSVYAVKKYGNQYFFLQKQIIGIAIGIVMMFIAANINFDIYRKLAYLMFFLALASLACIFIPGVGVRANGALRWIRVSIFRFQPAEFAKLATVFYLAQSPL